MFTGIIQHLGIVRAIEQRMNLIVLTVDIGPLAKKASLGDSVAINGVCLTVVKKKGNAVTFDMMKETLQATSLQGIKVKSFVNVELALQIGSYLGGHFVTGHVDAVATIKKITKEPNWVIFSIEFPKDLKRFIVQKGCITLDGISLTVGKVKGNIFDVYIIPFTLKVTNFGQKKAGDKLNIETDLLAKYIFNVQ